MRKTLSRVLGWGGRGWTSGWSQSWRGWEATGRVQGARVRPCPGRSSWASQGGRGRAGSVRGGWGGPGCLRCRAAGLTQEGESPRRYPHPPQAKPGTCAHVCALHTLTGCCLPPFTLHRAHVRTHTRVGPAGTPLLHHSLSFASYWKTPSLISLLKKILGPKLPTPRGAPSHLG